MKYTPMLVLVAAILLTLQYIVAPVPGPAQSAGTGYALDASHTGIIFAVHHVGISRTFGRFNDVSGSFTFDKGSPESATFDITIAAGSLDTNHKQRDDHLRGDDFFDARQFPKIRFQSRSVTAGDEGYTVVGDLTMHGKTRSVTLHLTGGEEAEFHGQRIGFSGHGTLKRSDFGVGIAKFDKAIGDTVEIMISFEGIKQ